MICNGTEAAIEEARDRSGSAEILPAGALPKNSDLLGKTKSFGQPLDFMGEVSNLPDLSDLSRDRCIDHKVTDG